MEEGLDQYVRVERLARARTSGRPIAEAPLTFIKPDSLQASAEPRLVDSVIDTVCHWSPRTLCLDLSMDYYKRVSQGRTCI